MPEQAKPPKQLHKSAKSYTVKPPNGEHAIQVLLRNQGKYLVVARSEHAQDDMLVQIDGHTIPYTENAKGNITIPIKPRPDTAFFNAMVLAGWADESLDVLA